MALDPVFTEAPGAAPRSVSSIGRACDRTAVPVAAPVRPKTRLALRPWDGIDVAEAALREAAEDAAKARAAKGGRVTADDRAVPLASSPREATAVREKTAAEASVKHQTSFAASVPRPDAAAALEPPPSPRRGAPLLGAAEVEDRPQRPPTAPAGTMPVVDLPPPPKATAADRRCADSTARLVERLRAAAKGHGHRVAASACFQAPGRPLREKARAPPTGQYFPRYGFVDRRPASALLLGRGERPLTPGTAAEPEVSEARPRSAVSGASTAPSRPKEEGPPVVLKERAALQSTRGTASFRSASPRIPPPVPPESQRPDPEADPELLHDPLAPLPQPGVLHHRGGRFAQAPRRTGEAQVPAGPNTLNMDPPPLGRPRGFVDFGRTVMRDALKGGRGYGRCCGPEGVLQYDGGDEGRLSTRPRTPDAIAFERQRGHGELIKPPTDRAGSALGPTDAALRLGTVAAGPSRGRVTMGTAAARPEAAPDHRPLLHPSYAGVERIPGAAVIRRPATPARAATPDPRHERPPPPAVAQRPLSPLDAKPPLSSTAMPPPPRARTPGAALPNPAPQSLYVSPVKPRPATAFIPRTTRASPVIGEGRCDTPDIVYDAGEAARKHVAAPAMGLQVSRVQRERRYLIGTGAVGSLPKRRR